MNVCGISQDIVCSHFIAPYVQIHCLYIYYSVIIHCYISLVSNFKTSVYGPPVKYTLYFYKSTMYYFKQMQLK